MEKAFTTIAKGKSKDELIRIVVNKNEYKNELVEVVEAELRLRDKEKVSILPNPTPQKVEAPKSKETPFSIYLAGILCFISGPIWFIIGFAQAGASAITDDTATALLSMWNIIIATVTIVIGIGILRGKKWGYEWGFGTAILGIIWFGFGYYGSESMFFIFLILLEIIIAISLRTNKEYFFGEITVLQNVTVRAPKNYVEQEISQDEKEDNDYKAKVLQLNTLLRIERKSLLVQIKDVEIRQLITELCRNKEEAEYLLMVYPQLFSNDLIEDLKKLSSNYAVIKEYCQNFIDLGIISKDYPHERLTQKTN